MAEDLAKIYQNLLYSKQTYDKGVASQNKGQKTWAANNANQYYSQLGADESAAIKGMNSQALSDYIKSKQTITSPPSDTPADTGTGGGIIGGGAGAGGSPQSFIDQLNAARRNQVLADLDKSRQNALSNLGAERSAIAPKYYDQRNQVAAGAQQQARNFAEFMASRGGTSSGANDQATLTQNMSTQGNLGTLGRQEAADFSDIERRTTGVNNAYESDVASANAGLEADRMNAMLQDFYNNQQRELQIAGLMGQFGNQRTLAGQQFDFGKQTDQRNFDYNKGIDQRDFDFQKELSDRDFNYIVGRDDVTDKQWAKEFGEMVKQNGIQNSLAQVRASSSGGSGSGGLSLAQKISIWKISGQAPEGIPGVAPGTKVYDAEAARKAAEKSGGVKLWEAIKGVVSSIGSAAGNASGVSDDSINQYLK